MSASAAAAARPRHIPRHTYAEIVELRSRVNTEIGGIPGPYTSVSNVVLRYGIAWHGHMWGAALLELARRIFGGAALVGPGTANERRPRWCSVTIEQLAADLFATADAVQKALQWLEQHDLIESVTIGRCNHYRILTENFPQAPMPTGGTIERKQPEAEEDYRQGDPAPARYRAHLAEGECRILELPVDWAAAHDIDERSGIEVQNESHVPVEVETAAGNGALVIAIRAVAEAEDKAKDVGNKALDNVIPIPQAAYSQPPAQLWDAVKAQLAAALHPGAYANWIAPTAVAGIEGDTLQVEVPDEMTGEYIQEQYQELVQAAVKHVGLPSAKIVYKPKLVPPPAAPSEEVEADPLDEIRLFLAQQLPTLGPPSTAFCKAVLHSIVVRVTLEELAAAIKRGRHMFVRHDGRANPDAKWGGVLTILKELVVAQANQSCSESVQIYRRG